MDKKAPDSTSGKTNGYAAFCSAPRLQALLLAILAAVVLLVPTWWAADQKYQKYLLKEQIIATDKQLVFSANALSRAINQRFALLEGLHAFVLANLEAKRMEAEFDIFAASLHASSSGIRNFAVARGGVQRYVYPLSGNEKVIGHDLLNDPRVDVLVDVQRAIQSSGITLSAPYELRQGGLGLVARKAVFLQGSFWGLTTMVLDLPPILQEAGLDPVGKEPAHYLRDSSGRVFYGNDQVTAVSKVTQRIDLPEGFWEITLVQEERLSLVLKERLALFRWSSLLVSVLLCLLFYLIVNRQSSLTAVVRKRTAELEEEISERRRIAEELKASQQHQRLLFELSPTGLALCRLDGNLVDANPAYAKIVGRSVAEVLRMSYWDITPEKYAAQEQVQLESLMTTGRYGPYEKEYRHRDGHLVPVILQGLIVENDGEQFIWSSAEDITERKSAAGVLRRNEQMLQLFVENSPASIAMFDRDMKYILVSRRFLLDYGLGDQNVIGRSHYEIFPDIPERWREIHRSCLTGATEKSAEESFPRANGEIDWVRWEIRPWYEIKGELGGIILFSEVITASKKASEEIKKINEELRTINRIIMTCATTFDTEEILNKVMDEALAITGLEGGTICSVTPEQTLQIIAHRETSQATIEDLTNHTIKVGDCLCGECARDHQPLILQDRAAVLKFSTREATRGEDIRFHAAFPLISGQRCLGVLCVFTRTDAKPTGKSLKLLESVSAQIAMAIDNAQLYAASLQQAARLEDQVLARTSDLDEARRALLNLVEDLHSANAKLKELDQLKSMFIASMSHELRTPLNSIIGFSGLMLQEMSGTVNDEQRDQLGRVFRAGKHLLSLITDVIDIAKIESGKITSHPEKFDLHALMDEAVGQVRPQAAGKGLAIEQSLPGQPMELYADRKRLLQCLLNYLSNAVKFSEKGTVTVEVKTGTRTGRQAGETPAGQSLAGGWVEFSVTDNGIGVKEKDMKLLFGSFVRLERPLKTNTPGTGLGLYLTKKLATEVLGGEVGAESEEGKGSRFWLRLPVVLSGKEAE